MKAAANSRRAFLAMGTGFLAVGFLPGCALPVIPKRPKPAPEDALGWIRFDGARYQLIIPRVEMGQNILTALKQLACAELGVSGALVDARLHDTQNLKRVKATVGSDSIKDFAIPLAQACATLRDGLARGTPQAGLKPIERPFGALKAFMRKPATSLVETNVPIEQGLAIVTGQPLYAADVARPGMLFGTVLRAPTTAEFSSKPARWNETAARQVAGFVALVHDSVLTIGQAEGLGVIAKTPGALSRIKAALDVQWEIRNPATSKTIDSMIDIDTRLQQSSRRSYTVHNAKVDQTMPWDVDLRIDIPLAAHASIQPRACVAGFKPDGALEMWVGSQDVFYQKDVICQRLGLDEQKVKVNGMRVGGAFGGKTICTVELEAAALAKAVNGVVKVQWSRTQEFQLGFHRPPSSHRIRARLLDGKLTDWWHSFASSHILFTNAALPPWIQKITDVIGDDGVARGAQLAYATRAKRTEFDLVRLPVYTGPWRGLGAGPNVFAIESAIDECAIKSAMDPVQFRLAHIEDTRLAQVLRRAALMARWGQDTRVRQTAPANAGYRIGRGVACGIYKAMSYAAVVADVEVNTQTGDVRVTQMWCAHDCGHVINPDQVKAQCEGNLVWGLGMVLLEHLASDDNGVVARSFAQSPIAILSDAPRMYIELIDDGQAPSGSGETAIVAAGAAIANAIRQATGFRVTRLPLNPGRLAEHLRMA